MPLVGKNHNKQENNMVEKIKTKLTSIDDLEKEVQNEINEDIIKKAKKELKEKLLQRTTATQVLKNIDREIKDLKLKISQELGN